MKKFLLKLTIAIFYFPFIFSQEVTILTCYESSVQNYPLIKKYDLLQKATHYNLSNVVRTYLPQGSLNGRASWQSDVLTFPFSVPGYDIPTFSKDQYQVSLDIQQKIWDGGQMNAQKGVEHASYAVQTKELQTNLYHLHDRVNSLYFSILLLKEQLQLTKLYQEDLDRNLKQIEKSVEFGIATIADLEEVKVTILEVKQQEINLYNEQLRYIEMLRLLTGLPIDKTTLFIRPSASPINRWYIQRPELSFYDAQINLMDKKRMLLNSSVTPQINLFAQGMYGRPGLNMLKNDFDFNFIGGVRVTFPFGGFNSLKNNKKLLKNSINEVQLNREIFLFNTRMDISSYEQNLLKIYLLMEQDDEIITLRSSIAKASESKYQNGTITINNLLQDISDANRARQQKSIHELESLQTIWQIKYLTNN